MNHKNDFKAFSIKNNANVVSQERYEESRSLKTGFPPDNITVHLLNKVLRQSSTITSVLANFIATYSGNDVLDNGDIVKLTAQLNGALEQKIATEVPNASLTQKGVTQLTDKTGNSNTLAVTQKLVSDVNDNANSKLSKNQNGADIPDKNAFVKNLNLLKTVAFAKEAVPSSRKINGKSLTSDVILNAGDIGAQPVGDYASYNDVSESLNKKLDKAAVVQNDGHNSNDVMSQLAVSERMIGIGQHWKDVTAQRAINIAYTNTSKKPIIVSIALLGSAFQADITVNGVQAFYISGAGSWVTSGSTAVIPAGASYKVVPVINAQSISIVKWTELS
ncbi:phage tail protein [Photorhabdus sp. APURE]|uniref:phage tail protein n=1 Tax=Photorhabdus aballayi TaxID=2991723 RepID=UPI00223D4293|nr:phage tail protein [Photorhabdus aballayi]MCW7548504.1 phage tail protein [Photorhabdus aballayi]